MKAYIIAEIEILDPLLYEEYKKLTPDSLAVYNGKFVARGGKTEVLESNWKPGRIVVLEFPSMEKAKQWWSSEEYATAKNIRQRSATTKMVLVEGFEL